MLRAVIVVALMAHPVCAQGFDGAETPDFAAARAAWLAGTDDAAVLAQLAALATQGNLAAQVMLGALVAAGLLPPGIEALPRAERLALTRAPGGLSGTSWLTIAGRSDVRAAAIESVALRWQDAMPQTHAENLRRLLEQGEALMALRLLGIFFNMGGTGPDGGWTQIADLALHPALQGHGAAFLAALQEVLASPGSGFANPGAAASLAEQLSAVAASDRMMAEIGRREHALLGSPEMRSLAARQVAGAPLAAPLLAYCEQACPADPEKCTLELVTTTGGVVGHLTLSPVETLIPSVQYQASPRFVGDVRARLGAYAGRIGPEAVCALEAPVH